MPDGTVTTAFPGDIDDLASVEVVYETVPGWDEDISGVRAYGDLPAGCRGYVERIEELCGVECRYPRRRTGKGRDGGEVLIKGEEFDEEEEEEKGFPSAGNVWFVIAT